MAKSNEPTTIKKYANRQLYNTGTSTYVTLEDLASMVKGGEDFVVQDAKSGEDITRQVLTQIIFEQENKGTSNLLPVAFLRQLIRFYGDSMQTLVPSFLEFSIQNLTRDQHKWREQMASGWTGTPWAGGLNALEEQARANMAIFERAFRMFSPFGDAEVPQARSEPKPESRPEPAREKDESLDDLKRQMAEMRSRLDQMSAPKS